MNSTAARSHTTCRRWWTACSRQMGAYGMTAVLGMGAISAAARSCGDAPPTQGERVIEIVNQRRAEAGRSPVRADADLNRAAQLHSKDQASHDRMSHIGSDGSNAGQRISRQGYRWSTWGENVAAGYPNAREVMRAWMNSPGHRRNILNSDFTEIGVGVARADDGRRYWTMVLARPR